MRSIGLRYLRWSGDGEAVQAEKRKDVENCWKTVQNPQRQVHAVLGCFVTISFRGVLELLSGEKSSETFTSCSVHLTQAAAKHTTCRRVAL